MIFKIYDLNKIVLGLAGDTSGIDFSAKIRKFKKLDSKLLAAQSWLTLGKNKFLSDEKID